jgi:hypothetical protein
MCSFLPDSGVRMVKESIEFPAIPPIFNCFGDAEMTQPSPG